MAHGQVLLLPGHHHRLSTRRSVMLGRYERQAPAVAYRQWMALAGVLAFQYYPILPSCWKYMYYLGR